MEKIKFKLLNIVDRIFLVLVLFLLSFVWINFFVRKPTPAIILSIILSLLIEETISFLNNKKKLAKTLKIERQEKINLYITSLMLKTKEETINFFYNAISKQENIFIKNNLIIYKNQLCGIACCLNKLTISSEDVLKIYHKAKKLQLKNLTILTVDCPENITLLTDKIEDVKITILNKNETFYNYLQKYNSYPKIDFVKKPSKSIKFKQILRISFNSTKSKHYLFSGIIIALCSLFVRFNIYYVIFSSILFLFSLISFFITPKTQ